MQHGLETANEQIERMNAAGEKVPSLIITVTGGNCCQNPLQRPRLKLQNLSSWGNSILWECKITRNTSYWKLLAKRIMCFEWTVDTVD